MSDWITVANALSVSRLVIAPLSATAVLAGDWVQAAAFFVWAAVSDLADGMIARRTNTATRIGGILDHASDAVFVSVTLWAVAHTSVIPGILPFLIVLAFLQYVIDSRAFSGEPLRTSQLGRYNGIAYFVLTGIVVIRNAIDLEWLTKLVFDDLIWSLGMILVLSTFVSIFERLRAFNKAFKENQ